MTSVPTWIGKAVIYTERYGTSAPTVTAITGWRATKTQVVVFTKGRDGGSVERRFSLERLTEIGRSKYDYRTPKLVPSDDERVIAAHQQREVSRALSHVLSAVTGARLQDSRTDPEDAVKKLFSLRVAIDEAIAMAGKVL